MQLGIWMRRVEEYCGGVRSFLRGTLLVILEQRGACHEQGLCTPAAIKTDSSTEILQARFMTRQHTDVIHKHRGREERR